MNRRHLQLPGTSSYHNVLGCEVSQFVQLHDDRQSKTVHCSRKLLRRIYYRYGSRVAGTNQTGHTDNIYRFAIEKLIKDMVKEEEGLS